MDNVELKALLARNIETALEDYGAHAPRVEYGRVFVESLARDAVYAKAGLRNLLRKSPAWNEELQALVINGNRTHNPNPDKVYRLANDILYNSSLSSMQRDFIACWFADDNPNGLAILNEVAPKAYVEGRKKSKVFRKLCEALGIVDDRAGSEFQRLYARLADEMSSKPIDFKLFVSIDPGAFLTMSNPKNDDRGSTMVSCHSLNDDSYTYNNGCSGYARDEVSMIAFTASDPKTPETLNNRKTSRQIYAYKPGSGILLQSRLYKTKVDEEGYGESYGGVDGDQPETKVYRDLIEREISECENVPNLWNVLKSSETCNWVERDCEFGGYPDWEFGHMAPHICLRADHTVDRLHVGAAGLCLTCGDETTEGLYCNDCSGRCSCDRCGDYVDEDYLTWVYARDGSRIQVCDGCRDEYYRYCEECGEYHWYQDGDWVGDDWVCEDCIDRYYVRCDDCGEYFREGDLTRTAHGDYVCDYCLDNDYYCCEVCGEYYPASEMTETADYDWVCEKCLEHEYTQCDDCGEYFRNEELTATADGNFCGDCIGKHPVTDPETGEILEDIKVESEVA